MSSGKKVQKVLKRAFDIVVSVVLLVALIPIVIIISVLVYIKLGRPVFFVQTRPGRDGRPFKIYKFRTMINIKHDFREQIPDEERLTNFGRFLRKTSLDELPELFNVIKGDMSLVGPRPLLVEYLELYDEQQARRHEVTPGITGWAQVNGRNSITWEEKFKLDVWYVEHWSLWLDIKILLLTIIKVVRQEGISQEGRATMDRFEGNKLK